MNQNGHFAAGSPRPYVITIASQKGGVAKTTTVVSLGGALVKLGYEVLLIDMDPQANLTLALGADPHKVRSGSAEVLMNSITLSSVSRESSIPGLDFVPCNGEMDLIERFLPVRQDYETLLRSALDTPTLREAYDFVLLDCPPALGAVITNALTASHLLLVPAQPEYFSAHALRKMMTLIRQVRARHNPDLLYRILITMMDRRNRIHRNLNEQIRTTFATGVLQTVIEIDTKLRESALAGLPITHFLAQSRSSQQYSQLAQELMEHVVTQRAQER